jgi:hypothetical protein
MVIFFGKDVEIVRTFGNTEVGCNTVRHPKNRNDFATFKTSNFYFHYYFDKL